MTDDGAIHEADLAVPALRLMAETADGCLTTTRLINALERIFNPTGKDAEIIPDRSDTYFSQKVRNLVSHRTSSSSFIANGYATYQRETGLCITDKGRSLLQSLGY